MKTAFLMLALSAVSAPPQSPDLDRAWSVPVHDELLRGMQQRSQQPSRDWAEEQRQAQISRESTFRQVTEEALRDQLKDPESAEFKWPYGFIYRDWGRHTGYMTCGSLNARNGFGGYTGFHPFIVVIGRDAKIQLLEFGSERDSWVTSLECRKAEKGLPPAEPELNRGR